MHFKIGDYVAVVDDTLKGDVVAVTNDLVSLKDSEGMVYSYHPSELVLIKDSQFQLSKYSDIHNPLLKEKMKETTPKKSAFKKIKSEVILEVDLHIHKLKKTTKGMDNFDMLSLQLDTARLKLEFAIRKRISKIVFIHGVGEGVLKSELTYLFNKYPVKYYDASYQKYGLGATEVYIYQNPNS
ncbi:DNA mismatch repair protein MutS [Flavobacteriaceae bacterium S356]|uniref:DNA mismatch repair protein MutS n=1 Tax=Asprobacillus argus TaxID=3076534 RepID=A0ABU3LED0_9FLAO|nr:DNA mismatch repair protein MutS [Flavobacteriaceae bacterium S356]